MRLVHLDAVCRELEERLGEPVRTETWVRALKRDYLDWLLDDAPPRPRGRPANIHSKSDKARRRRANVVSIVRLLEAFGVERTRTDFWDIVAGRINNARHPSEKQRSLRAVELLYYHGRAECDSDGDDPLRRPIIRLLERTFRNERGFQKVHPRRRHRLVLSFLRSPEVGELMRRHVPICESCSNCIVAMVDYCTACDKRLQERRADYLAELQDLVSTITSGLERLRADEELRIQRTRQAYEQRHGSMTEPQWQYHLAVGRARGWSQESRQAYEQEHGRATDDEWQAQFTPGFTRLSGQGIRKACEEAYGSTTDQQWEVVWARLLKAICRR